MDKIAALIPCCNEAQTIAKVVADFRRELPEAVIYVYDNNSSDGTDEFSRAAGTVVRYEHQQGKGAYYFHAPLNDLHKRRMENKYWS